MESMTEVYEGPPEPFIDKLPRIVFLGASGAIAIHSYQILPESRSAAAVGVGGGLIMWLCWALLFYIGRVKYR